jgi:hypothetical protein
VPLEYENAWSFSEGLAAVLKGDKLGFIDTKGRIAVPFIYDDVIDVI